MSSDLLQQRLSSLPTADRSKGTMNIRSRSNRISSSERRIKRAKISCDDLPTSSEPSSDVDAPSTASLKGVHKKMPGAVLTNLKSLIEHKLLKSLPSSNPSALLRSTQQRQEYDEGMYFYSDTLSVTDTLPEETMRSAAFFYNAAQTNVKQGIYEEAVKLWELALVRVPLDLSHPLAALMAAQIYHNLGHCWYRLGCNEASMLAYHQALRIANQTNLGAVHTAAAQNAIAVLLFHRGGEADKAEALALLRDCWIRFSSILGSENTVVANVLNNMGRLSFLNGDYTAAMTSYEQALSIRVKELGKDSVDVGATVCNIAQTYHKCGGLNKALEYYLEFLRIAESNIGSVHGDIAFVLKSMGEIHQEQNNLAQAKTTYERALLAGRTSLGSQHPEIASILNKLGNVSFELDDLEAALQFYKEGLLIEEVVFEPNHHFIHVTLMNIAQILRHLGMFAEALKFYARLHRLQVSADNVNDIKVAHTLSCMGLMQYQLKNFQMAFNHYREALRLQRNHYGEEGNEKIASTLNSIGLVLFNQGVYDLAKTCFTDSLRIRLHIMGPNHRDVAILWYNIATIYLELGEDEVAIKLYKETLRVEKSSLGVMEPDVVLTLQHLGLIYQRRGELEEALNYFTEALHLEKSRVGSNVAAVGKLLNLIGNIHLQKADVAKMMEVYIEASRLYNIEGNASDMLVIAGYNFYGVSRLHPPCAPAA